MAAAQPLPTPAPSPTAVPAAPKGSEDEMKMPVRRIVPYLKPVLPRFILGLVMGIVAAMFNAVWLPACKIIFAIVLPDSDGPPPLGQEFGFLGLDLNFADMLGLDPSAKIGLTGVIIAASFIPLMLLINGVLDYLNKYLLAWVGNQMLQDIRNDVFGRVLRQSPAFFGGTKAGELIQTVLNQTAVAQRNAVQYVQVMTSNPLKILVILISLFAAHPFFTFMSLFIFPLCLLPVMRLGKKVRKSGKKEEQMAGAMLTAMHESLSGIRLVKSYAREEYEVQRFVRANASMSKNAIRWQRASEMVGPIVESVASLGIAAGLVYWWAMGLKSSEFIAVVLLLTRIYPPAKELSKVNLLLQKTRYAINNVVLLLDREPDIQDVPDAKSLGRVKGEIHFENITFAYSKPNGEKLDRPALNGVDIKLAPGRFYAFVGPSGAGKSTLFSLILRFYDPDSGRVLIDGHDLRSVTQNSLRENIGIVSQDTFLFHDTIRENIRYGRLDATEEEIIAAAKKAHAHEFIMQIEGGYDAVVGDAGCNLSGGQKQRLSIARAVLRNAPILLLDEATSALDTETEKIIQEAIHELSEGRTVIAIAHRLSTILQADQIIVMKEGQVESSGTHNELLKKSELYQKLAALQFSE
ncbi:ABC transporter ATP-binding protein [Brevifollis gellanilyticus]|uniref:ABC transporter ATP-binding protein n=1 Tax=Brevifollis gellanilyticus TaxID=748831 RepID=A0A512ME92_9BACT|nr:ABC transporter ATP-binding protein [Brevifollis gellanilyticus]GEP45028.1 ABC transporter ATP-binding protein [Brevifollis gellanilyticus]